jgi:hypothetical protein
VNVSIGTLLPDSRDALSNSRPPPHNKPVKQDHRVIGCVDGETARSRLADPVDPVAVVLQSPEQGLPHLQIVFNQ